MNKLFTLFTLLLLLPLAARAAAPSTLTVGGTDVLSGSYWLTNADDGTLTADGASADNYNVYYDATGTLTLKDATINGTNTIGHVGAGIFASGDLTIVLEGSSTVTGVQDPNGDSQSIRVEGNLTIQGGGSLTAQGAETSSGSSYGIFVIGSFTQQGGSVTASGGNVSGNYNSTGLYVYGSTVTVQGGTLTATGGTTGSGSYGISMFSSVTVGNATVTATGGTGKYSYGLYIDSSSPSVTLSDNGSLTARSESADKAGGIYFQNPFGSAGSVTVGDNSTLLANSVIRQDRNADQYPLAPTGNGSWLIYGQSNQTSAVGGNYTLKENITIPEDVTLTIPAGSTLTVPQGKTLTVNGTLNIANQSSLTGSGSLAGSGAFNLTNPDPVISGSETLTYDGTDQSSQFTLTAPTATEVVMEKVFNISESPNFEGWTFISPKIKDAGTYILTVTNGTSTIMKDVTVKPAEISITGATLAAKTYDGNQDATVTGVEFTGLVNSESLSLGTDYTATAVFGSANAGSQTATVTVTLTNTVKNYTLASGGNTATATASIKPLQVELSWDYDGPFTYDGNEHSVTASISNTVNEDAISLNYDSNSTTAATDAGTYTATVSGLTGADVANYTLDGVQNLSLAWSIVGVSIADAKVTLDKNSFTYTGSEQNPEVMAVTLDEKALTEDIDYTVTYSDKSINAGEYTVTITGTGNYSGTVTATYTISPAALTITGATLASKTYDGTTNATVESVTFSGLVNSESLSMDTDYTATAVFDDANAGTGKSATVTVTLSNGNYSLATSTYMLENQTIARADFDGTTEISGSVLANSSDEVKLPDIPDGASYGTPTYSDSDLSDLSISEEGVLSYTGSSDITAGNTYTITIPVNGATNYNDYNITVTLTGKLFVTVEAEGSTNLSLTTNQAGFTLTATVQAEGGVLNPQDGSWTWTVADEAVVALSANLRSVSVSSSSQTFTIEGTGTTTITATYDDGTYRGSVDFTVRISKPTPPDPISYYNIYVEDVCDGVEVSTSKQVVREGGSITVYVEKDTANYTFDNFKVYYKRSYYGGWEELKEGTQPGEYPIKNIWTHIYIKAEGAEEKEDPTGIESIEGVKVYTKDGSLYVQTPQREQVIIVSMSGAVVKNEEQVGLKQYHGLQPGIYIVRVGDRAYKVRLN